MASFFRFFAGRHILATLITMMICMLGVSTLMDIKRDIYPQVDFGMMNIVTAYPGAAPEDVELNVTNKIETELNNVSGIENIMSVSLENVSIINVFIDSDERDPSKIKSEIREAVGRVTDFPEEVTQSPLITEPNSTNSVIIEVGVSGEVPYSELREVARLFEKKLKILPGISRVESIGYREKEIRVEVSPEAIEEYQVPLKEIISAIQRRNIRSTSGSFESYTSEQNLVTLAQFEDPMEVGDVIVRSTFDGVKVRVKDLAVVTEDFADEEVLSRIDGITSISFLVYLSKSADVIRTCDKVKELINIENPKMPDGVQILYSNDTSRIVRGSFDVVRTNGIIGLLLLMILLPIFLNFRTALWVALGIPVALLGTIFLLPIFGMYLDTITLSGMILVIGIIVDDAIIIAENISTRREKGDEPLEAAVNGLSEVFLPVLTTILTTFLVFAPMFFMPGVFGKYIVPIPLAISIALFVSLLEVVIALPAHLVPGMKKRKVQSTGRTWFRNLSGHYRKFIYSALRFRYLLIIGFVFLLGISIWYAGNYMKFIMFPSDTADSFHIGMELPIGTPLKITAEKIRTIEDVVKELPDQELASFSTRIGRNPFIDAESENYATLSITLSPYTERDRTAAEIVETLRSITDEIQGHGEIIYLIETGGPPVGKPVSLNIVGSDDILRTSLADSVVAFLNTIDGVKDITRDDVSGKGQVEIQINYDNLSRLGLTVADVAQNVRIAYDGQVVTSVRYGDEDVEFRVLIDKQYRQKLNFLTEVLIPNQQGRLIPLKDVAQLQPGPGNADYRHYNGERTITIESDVDQDIITPVEVTDILMDNFNVDRDWPGIRMGAGGELFETEKSMAGLFRTLMIALIGIFFLLVLLFNSLAQPFLVMAAIPFGITGVIAAFGFHGQPMSFMGVMGIIGLSGVVVNDSLVLVSHINDLKRKKIQDTTIRQIVAEGTADRLRAIILTTLSTVVALLPLAYGLGGTAAFMQPMAMSLGWGLLFATPLTLILVPSLFLVGQDMSGLIKRKK